MADQGCAGLEAQVNEISTARVGSYTTANPKPPKSGILLGVRLAQRLSDCIITSPNDVLAVAICVQARQSSMWQRTKVPRKKVASLLEDVQGALRLR
ncbi:hypothetical protein KEM56_004110, partial [Ascosphaera pollenicola]